MAHLPVALLRETVSSALACLRVQDRLFLMNRIVIQVEPVARLDLPDEPGNLKENMRPMIQGNGELGPELSQRLLRALTSNVSLSVQVPTALLSSPSGVCGSATCRAGRWEIIHPRKVEVPGPESASHFLGPVGRDWS